jgi:hypothetical protein
MTRGSEAMTWRWATSFGTRMTRGSDMMTWRDDVDRKREFGIWSKRGNPESKREGFIFEAAFWDWDVVAKRFWGAFSGRELRGVSSDCESVAER